MPRRENAGEKTFSLLKQDFFDIMNQVLLICRFLFYIKKKRLRENEMSLSRYEFEILKYLEKRGSVCCSIRELSDEICISGSTVRKMLHELEEKKFIAADGKTLTVMPEGLNALEPYRVKRAIIVAAGFGSRMMPATADRPKPMVRVNGVRIIDTLMDALTAAGITDVTVVGGYQYDKLKDLLGKYPFLRLVENTAYAAENNISSAMCALDQLYGGCYFCEADLYISNPAIITKYQYASNILGSWSLETDDWSFKMADGYLTDYRKGNTYCYNYYGISFWTAEDCEKLRRDFAAVYQDTEKGKEYFWEFIPFVLMKEKYRVEIRPCRKQDIMEIDNYFELQQLDAGYV